MTSDASGLASPQQYKQETQCTWVIVQVLPFVLCVIPGSVSFGISFLFIYHYQPSGALCHVVLSLSLQRKTLLNCGCSRNRLQTLTLWSADRTDGSPDRHRSFKCIVFPGSKAREFCALWLLLVLCNTQDAYMNTPGGAGVPMFFGIDSVHGAIYVQNATVFPQQINVGASFNPELAYRMGEITAKDTRQAGAHG